MPKKRLTELLHETIAKSQTEEGRREPEEEREWLDAEARQTAREPLRPRRLPLKALRPSKSRLKCGRRDRESRSSISRIGGVSRRWRESPPRELRLAVATCLITPHVARAARGRLAVTVRELPDLLFPNRWERRRDWPRIRNALFRARDYHRRCSVSCYAHVLQGGYDARAKTA